MNIYFFSASIFLYIFVKCDMSHHSNAQTNFLSKNQPKSIQRSHQSLFTRNRKVHKRNKNKNKSRKMKKRNLRKHRQRMKLMRRKKLCKNCKHTKSRHNHKSKKSKKHRENKKYKMNKYRHTKRRKKKTGNQETIFAGNDCEWIDLCGLKTSAGNCSDGNKAVIKNAKGARKQFLIVDGKVLYGFVKFKKKFASCQGVKERTASVNCKYVAKSDVSSIQLRTSKLPKIKVHDKPSKKGAYTGKECQYVDICSVRSAGQGCVDGSKFVLKSGGGVRKQFLITNNKLILAFVTFGKQFADCQSFTDVTSSITCKAVDNLSGFKLTTPTPAPSGSCKCGVKKVGTRVVGGSPTEVNEYPWMVGLSSEKDPFGYNCGGALVASQWVVTAAHCITSGRQYVTLGDHNMFSDEDTTTKTIKAEKIIVHPDYGSDGNDNDIGLLKLSEAVDLNTYTPVCLPEAGADFTGQKGWIVGWGSSTAVRTEILNELELPIVSDSVCKKAFTDAGFDYKVTSDMLCAGGEKGKDGCQGDSGGPFTVPVGTSEQHYLAGAVSWGEGCAREGLYGVYAEVAMFRTWMDKQIHENGGQTKCTDGSSGTTAAPEETTAIAVADTTASAGNCKCGIKKVGTRIVGGSPTEVNEYPWMVGLSDSKDSSFYNCGGALVASQWVVTAAHCIRGATTQYVTLGDHNTNSNSETTTKTIKAEKIISHPDYGNSGNGMDFGLLKLSEAVDLNTYTPVCLPEAGADFTGQKGWIVGWGSSTAVRTDILNELELSIVSDSVCEKAFSDAGINAQVTSDMLCAGGDKGKDGCQGDSGGPFTVPVGTSEQHYLAGAVSWGEGCAREGLYGVYAEVAMFRTWMDKQIDENGGATKC